MKKYYILLSFIFLIAYNIFINFHSYAAEESFVNIPLSDKVSDDLDFRVIQKVDLSNFELPLCVEVPLLFSKCIPSACKIKAPYGEVIAHIKSSNSDKCLYSEKTIGIGGLDCEIPQSELEELEKAFHNRFSYISQAETDLKMTDEYVTANENIFKKYCVFKKDFALYSFVTIGGLGDPSRVVDPDIKKALENNIQNKELITDKTAQLSATENDKKQSLNISTPKKEINKTVTLENFTSIIYTKEELELITRLLEGLSDVTEFKSSVNATISKGPGVYTLDSLIYKNTDSWTVWLNGKRYDEKNNSDSIRIARATKNFVVFRWNVPNIDRVSPNWKEHLVEVNSNKYASSESDIVLDIEDGKFYLSFKLKPRQTFVAQSMEIKEGK